MRSTILPLFFFVCCTPLHAAIPVPDRVITDPVSVTSPESPDAAPIPIDDLAISRGLFDAAWSIDGKHVFLSTNLTGRYNIWRMESEGSWPVPLTVSDDAQAGLSPSPDGRTLLFTQDVGGNQYSDVYAVPTSIGWLVLSMAVALPAAAQHAYNLNLNAQLLVAARQGDLPTLGRLLDKGAAPNSRNRLGKTSLLIAAEKGQLAMVERLLAAGADVQQAFSKG